MIFICHINDIEFITASCEDGCLSLHCVKEREKRSNCPFAWISSPAAHREFQELRHLNNNGKASDRMKLAFLQTVQGCSDEMVGGFCISAGLCSATKTLGYRFCKTFQYPKEQLIQQGEAVKFWSEIFVICIGECLT